MLAIGLQGSPRHKGNNDFLLTTFMAELAALGIHTRIIDVCRHHIEPCREIALCETQGVCAIEDDMSSEIYGLLRQAEIVVAASPIFFYNVSAQLKALIDRCQALWARKYMLKLNDPAHRTRRGYFLAAGATGGRKLFDGAQLTARYFFDAISASFCGSLTYRRIENRGQIQDHPTVREDLAREALALAAGLAERPKVLFVGRENNCRSQMAAAFAQWYAGDRLDVACAGSRPTAQINPLMIEVMREKGIDMAFRVPQPLEKVVAHHLPRHLITMGSAENDPLVSDTRPQAWNLPDPAGGSKEMMQIVRDKIETRVKAWVDSI